LYVRANLRGDGPRNALPPPLDGLSFASRKKLNVKLVYGGDGRYAPAYAC
jgi:hypothetical protein